MDWHRVLELEIAGDRRHAAKHEGDIARRPAHVVGDDVGELAGEGPRLQRRRRRGDHARRRPRHHGRDRVLGDDRGRHRAAVALHDEQLAREAAPGELARKALEVAVQHRLDRGVDGGGRAALVLALLGDDGVSRGHVAVRPERANDLGGARLVRRIDVAVQEVDDDAFRAELDQLRRGGRDRGLVERHRGHARRRPCARRPRAGDGAR